MILRDYMPSDCREMAELFFDTVHTVNRGDYSEEQVNAWADGSPDLEKWNRSFLAHTTVVAEEDGRIVGFGDIDPDGYLDRLYVRSDKQRKGIASAVCERLENAVGAAVITTHASITARGFFEKRGYVTVKEQKVLRHGVLLTNYVMMLDRRARNGGDGSTMNK